MLVRHANPNKPRLSVVVCEVVSVVRNSSARLNRISQDNGTTSAAPDLLYISHVVNQEPKWCTFTY